MCADFLSAAGPLAGPDFVLITVTDAGTRYELMVYPDANNPQLKEAGIPTQYYFQPAGVYLAKRPTDPANFEFGMTVFKGLLTSDRDVGVTSDVEVGGGWCTFTTTFGVPEGVVEQALQKLLAEEHPKPAEKIAPYFNYSADAPTPKLGVVTITADEVTINVANLTQAGGANQMWVEAVGSGKGSIAANGLNSFLVTCNELAAGAIAGSLKAGGVPPFLIACNLKEQFYIDAATVTVKVDVDKVYDAVSVAISAGGFLGIGSASLNAAYSNMQTTSAIAIDVKMDGAVLTEKEKEWIQGSVDEMRKRVFELVKKEIFEWEPGKGETPATAERGWASSLFGGASASLKTNYQRRGLTMEEEFKLETTITVNQTVHGTLDELMPAVKADLEKYLAIVDIGQFFEKMQVAATCAVSFDATLPDGTNISDPVASVELVPSYPDFDQPLNSDGTPNLVQAEGFAYTIGQTQQPAGAATPLIWRAANAGQSFNAAWLRLSKDVPGWHAANVQLAQTLVYNGDDPRVDLQSGGVTWTSQHETETEHAPILTASAVGYVYVHFVLDRVLPTENITITVTLTIGGRTDTLTVTQANQHNILWEIFSDKFFNAAEFTYSIEVEVTGPEFTDNPVSWKDAAPISVAVPIGRIKYLNPFKLPLPPIPAAEAATVNEYIRKYPASTQAAAKSKVVAGPGA